ncbi:chemotaxis protein CheW [bacterium]|nr:chemotaxis protein CheW [bacterium]MBU1989895.1 chemotaxis protein CheW [bacterium]
METEISLFEDDELMLNHENQYFLFYSDGDIYGIDASCIVEIVEYQSYTKVPNLSSFVLGVTNIRGDIVSVIDFLDRCKISSTVISKKSAFIILSFKKQKIALLVDEIYEVDGFDDSSFLDAPKFGTKIESHFISKLVEYRGKNISILNLDRLLNLEELSCEVLYG